MVTIPFPQGFPKDEVEDFDAACRKYRVSIDDFLIKGEIEQLAARVQPIQRQVLLVHIPTKMSHRYEGGHNCHWTADFESDLADGTFIKRG